MTTCLSGGETFVLKSPVAIGKEEQQTIVMLIARDIELNRLRSRISQVFHADDAEMFDNSDEDMLVARLIVSRMLTNLTGEVFEECWNELRWLIYDVITQQGDLLNSASGRVSTSEKILSFCLKHNWDINYPAQIHLAWAQENQNHKISYLSKWLSREVAL